MTWINHKLSDAELRDIAHSCSEDEARRALYDWHLWARPEQRLPAGDWRTWLILCGRGWGKTRTLSETAKALAAVPGRRIALVGPTAADCRDVLIEGESGLLSCYLDSERPYYHPSKRSVTFRNGTVAFLYSAEEPERLRGPQHHFAICDEFAAYPKQNQVSLWANLKLGLRLGADPRAIVGTTPKPTDQLRAILKAAGTFVTKGKTYDNRANLPAAALAEFDDIYGGTRIGRQEIHGELLDDAEGALWLRGNIEQNRVRTAPDLVSIVVAIDPAVTSTADSDECGIVAAGRGADGHGYVLRDVTCRLPPAQWAARAVSLFDLLQANKVIGETNNGGDLIAEVLRTVRPSLPFEKVHASRGKVVRAEPIASLYEQNRVHHVGEFAELETEMCNFVPGELDKSPNRADALVWALSWLMLKPVIRGRAIAL